MGVKVRARSKTFWMMVLACVCAACSKDDKERQTLQMAGGPPAPELAFRADPEPAESAPIALTASDGTGLELVSLEARTVIEDPLAFTELHLTFHNPQNIRREGRFEITLPQEAAISRFAMRVAAGFQEGEVVERKRAQQVYEDFLHRKQDPALLEKNAGNQFAARVFPIEANADKEIIIAYSEELREHLDPYRLLLKGLPRLRRFRVDVRVGSRNGKGDESKPSARAANGTLSLNRTDYVPEGDLEVRLPFRKPFALRHGELVIARVTPVTSLPAEDMDGLTVLFDTSASRALGYGAQIEHLEALLKALRARKGKDFDLRVLAFDQGSEEIYRGPVSGFGVREEGKLLARDALGASDLAQALALVAQAPSGHARLLLVGDGVVTAGTSGTTELRDAVAKLGAHGVRRFDVLGEGGIQDQETLRSLTRAGLARTGVVLDARQPADKLASKLLLATKDRVEVRIAGATFVYPQVLEGVQPGDDYLIFAQIPNGMPVQIELADAGATALPTLEAPAELIERAIARAHIAALSHALRALGPDADQARRELEAQIVKVSIEQRVVSDLTALLVLETESDYQRFGIAQAALTSILRVGEQGIEVFDRARVAPLEVAKGEGDFGGQPPEAPSQDSAARRRASAQTGHPLDEPLAPDEVALQANLASRGAARKGEAEVEAKADMRPRPNKVAAEPTRMASKPSAAGGAPAAAPAPASAVAMAGNQQASEGLGRLEVSTLRSRARSGESALLDRAADKAPVLEVARPELEIPAQMTVRVSARVRSVVGLSEASAGAVARGLQSRARACFVSNTQVGGQRLTVVLDISERGLVRTAVVSESTLQDNRARACLLNATQSLRFPKPDEGSAHVELALSFAEEAYVEPVARTAPRPSRRPRVALSRPALADAYEGDLAAVLQALQQRDVSGALARAASAHQRDPGDVMALIALGEALEAQPDLPRAARAYGSLIDLFPGRADIRRMAGARLERLKQAGLLLAIDSYRQAVTQRPDQPSGHRLLAYALLQQGERAAAFHAIEQALDQPYPEGRFEGVDRILREDLSLLASVWLRAEPAAEAQIKSALGQRGLPLDQKPSLRFVLNWETDANDVDFHIYDGRGGHAFYMQPKLGSGGALYADVTTGFGPECFTIAGSARAYPYTFQAHYFSRGPMGYGMGKLQVIEHDGKGGIKLSEHPFVIMKDKAFLELAELSGPLP